MAWQNNGYSPWFRRKCDICCNQIKCVKYECHDCISLTICALCHSLQRRTLNHDPKKHVMKTIYSDLNRKSDLLHTVYCDGCKSTMYPGKRYRCKDEACQKQLVDLCVTCYKNHNYGRRSDTHRSSHKMRVFEKPEEGQEYYHYLGRAVALQNSFGYGLATMGWAQRNIRKDGPWSDQVNLGVKIGYAYYGEPTRAFDGKSFHYGYTDEQDKHITDVINILLNLEQKKYSGSEADVKFVFASFFHSKNKIQGTLPLIHLRLAGFVEPSGRTYDDWDDFLDKNLLPACTLIYPEGGEYKVRSDGLLNLVIGETAGAHMSKQIAQELDKSTAIIGTTFGVVAGIGLLTPFAPLAGAALASNAIVCGGIGVGRSAYRLTDRALHNESILPTNLNNVFDWLAIVGSAASFGAMGAASYAARGVALSQTARVLVNIAIFGNLALSATSNGVSLIVLLIKLDRGEKVTPLEIVQLASGITFFAVSCIKVKTASKLIIDSAQEKISAERAQLSTDAERANFDAALTRKMQDAVETKQTKGDGRMHGLLAMQAEIDQLRQSGRLDGHFNTPASKTGARHAAGTTGYVRGDGTVTRTVNKDGARLEAFHERAAELREQAKIDGAAKRNKKYNPTPIEQRITTAVHMNDTEFTARLRNVLEKGQGGTWKANPNRANEKIVTLEFEDAPQPGTNITSRVDGPPKLENIGLTRISVVIDAKGQPVHYDASESAFQPWNDSALQNMRYVPAYVTLKGDVLILHGVLPPNFQDYDLPAAEYHVLPSNPLFKN